MAKLYLVPTPIGNLEDITLRALQVLKNVNVILAEDTRNSGKLLKHFQINTPMQSHHKFNEHQTLHTVIQQIKNGQDIALITDAGTPAISDPGFLLVRECIRENIDVESLPGATAFVPALINSGLPNERFVFEGFLPDKKGKQTRLKALENEPRTMIFYVSPYKLTKTLQDFITFLGEERQASVSRELTKIYEETKRGSLSDLYSYYQSNPPKGEIVLIIEGKK
ncbi:MAG: 16S rRNA (cytidine(1402)-2'-O)-methyltransferase [Capnocytophaga sp.]|nr:16S rRNA (cytidine(1402)-2'-O)-methyltransferase [Capnocytophaga sp.]